MKKQLFFFWITSLLLVNVYAQHDNQKPDARARGHLIYHPSSKAMLLFDGYVNHSDSTENDVWKWDGQSWSRIIAYGPGSRILNAAALNNRTGEIEFFGGWGSKTIDDKKNDSWCFNGSAWRKLNTETIGTRDHHKMVFADHLGAFVVYGGFDVDFNNDTVTWLLKDNHFRAIPIKGPGARGNFGFTYDKRRKKVVLFGGNFSKKDAPADLWEFDGTKWEEIKVPDIGISSTHAMVYAEHLSMSIVQNEKGETLGWDGAAMKKIAVNGPTEFGIALGYDPDRKMIIGYGGFGTQRTAVSALWELRNGIWKKVSDNGVWKQISRDRYERIDPGVDTAIPRARWAHHLVYDHTNKRVLLFGGSRGNQILGDLWTWDGLAWNELTVGGPPARSKGIFVYDINRHKAVLFGGADSGDNNINDTWEWDGSRWEEIKGDAPPPRVHGLGVFDEKNKTVLVFGGFGFPGVLNDTWAFDGNGWKLINANGPANCLPHGMIYNRERNAVIMITVKLDPDPSTGKPMNEMWEWKDTGWKKLSIAVPSITGLQSFISTGNNMIVFDGSNMPGNKGTTWEYAKGKWSIVSSTGPGIRMGHVITYDSHRKKVVLFGGGRADSSERYNDTWEWDGKQWKKIK